MSQSGNASDLSLISIQEIVGNFENDLDRASDDYQETMSGLADLLNQLPMGCLKNIDVAELRGQTGFLLYYTLKGLNEPVPFDVAYTERLLSHFRNPTILVLRRIRKFLMPVHRKLLARLEEEQNRERQIHFRRLDIDRKVKVNLEEMQRFQTMAQLTRSVTRKLDILASAVTVPYECKIQFRLIELIIADPYHLRHERAIRWLKRTPCLGDKAFMKKLIEKGTWVLDRKTEKIKEDLEKLSGLPFRDVSEWQGGSWYSLTSPAQRGEDFISIFNKAEQIEQRIKQVTYFVIQTAYNAGKFRALLDEQEASNEKTGVKVAALSNIYFELERCIQESGRSDGEALSAVTSDLKYGLLNKKEAEDARKWIGTNRLELQALKIEAFQMLLELRKENGAVPLPEEIEQRIEEEHEHFEQKPGDEVFGDILPRIPLKTLEAELEQLEVEASQPDGSLLQAFCDFLRKVVDWQRHLGAQGHYSKLRQISDDFQEYEGHLLRFYEFEEKLDELKKRGELQILEIYHNVYLGSVPRETLDQAFEIVIDHVLQKIRLLEYEILDADRYRNIFERALSLEGHAAYMQLDELFRELHALPRQAQLIQALSEWEKDLDRETLMDKQAFIVENEFQLQELVDQVRAELRERMMESRIDSRRLRFDVFSLSDCYSGNLETALEALMRAVGRVASDQEGEILLEHLQALEGQVIEAQRVTRPQGEAMRKLRDLERSKLMPTTFLDDLRQDLDDNFEELDKLLGRITSELRRVRKLQNRFGGDHDTAVFSLAINFYDQEQLKSIYHFVENITMMDLKRFGLVYNQKNAMLEDLLQRSLRADPSVPEHIASMVNRRVFRAFKESKNLPLDLKILILWELPEFLESECELMIRTLNFVDHHRVSSKAVYTGLMQILEKCQGGSAVTIARLKRIWGYFQSRVNGYQPSHYLKNYELNRRLLMEQAREIIGKRLR